MTVIDFHSLGSSPSPCELLKEVFTDATRRCEHFSIPKWWNVVRSSSFVNLRLLSATSIYVTVIINSTENGSSASNIGWDDCNIGKYSHTDKNNPLIELTKLSISTLVFLFIGQPLHLIAAVK